VIAAASTRFILQTNQQENQIMQHINKLGYRAALAAQAVGAFALWQKAITAEQFAAIIIFCTFAGCFFIYQSTKGD
jgi:hypothetical protein